jgi:hypothetical protein
MSRSSPDRSARSRSRQAGRGRSSGADYERPVPTFDRPEAIGVVRSGGSWQAIRRLSEASAVNGFVNFFVFDPSPVMHLNGSTGNAVTYLTGNIVQAEHGFRQLPGCFLYVLLRVVIADTDGDGEASLSIDHPADLLAAYGDAVLDAVAADFCSSLAALLAPGRSGSSRKSVRWGGRGSNPRPTDYESYRPGKSGQSGCLAAALDDPS